MGLPICWSIEILRKHIFCYLSCLCFKEHMNEKIKRPINTILQNEQ